MPTRKVKGGYRYGTKGKTYKAKSKANRQGRAIKASQARDKKMGSSATMSYGGRY